MKGNKGVPSTLNSPIPCFGQFILRKKERKVYSKSQAKRKWCFENDCEDILYKDDVSISNHA